MALISCPECGHKVSTAADACPGCGFPVSKMVSAPADSGYTLELVNKKADAFKILKVAQKLFSYDFVKVDSIRKSDPAIIASNLSLAEAKKAYLMFKVNKVPVRVLFNGVETQVAIPGEICCPFCGSQQLQGKKQGFGFGKAAVGALVAGPVGLLAGGIGSTNDRYTCLECGIHGIKFD